MMYTYTQGCHGCGGKGWVSPSYGTAVVCPVCGGSGVARKPSTAVPGTPYIAPTPTYPSIPFGNCPNAMSGVCFCTGACRSGEDNWTEWKKYFNAKDDDNNGTSKDER